MIELELKAVVADPAALRTRLLAAGAAPGFRGRMEDRRFDRQGELLARDEVLRVRRFFPDDGPPRARVSWKGPVSVDRGYKRRPELEYEVASGGAAVDLVFDALGYRLVEAIDRTVEYFDLGQATVRIEWYPRMDVLVEVEGAPEAIEAAARVSGIPREAFTAEPLVAFVARYEAREGRPAEIGPGPDVAPPGREYR